MALFSICKRFSIFRSFNIKNAEFHTLRKLENFSFAKRTLRLSVTPRRNFFWIFQKRSKREVRAIDQPPDSYQLIYRNGLDHYFLVGQYCFCFISAAVGLLVIYESSNWTDTTSVNEEILGICSGFLFIACLFYFQLARTPMRIYYHPQKQKYLMYSYGPIPNQMKKQALNVSDIVPAPGKGIIPWSDCIFQHKSGQKLILIENCFRNPADLYVLLGWQKDPNEEGYKKVEDKK